MSFLPDDYQAPITSANYMKLQEGDNKFRILSKPILGWEDWINNKPVRFTMDKKPAAPSDPTKPIKHFWAFIVFNYAEEQIQIMHLTQNSIRRQIEALSVDKDWGSPFTYDMKINKTGEGMNTKYMVNPLPHKPLDERIVKAFNAKPCQLEALFIGGDPFSPEWKYYTQLAINQPASPVAINQTMAPEPLINNNAPTSAEIKELEMLFSQCSEDYRAHVMRSLTDYNPSFTSFNVLPIDTFTKVKNGVIKRREDEQKAKEYAAF